MSDKDIIVCRCSDVTLAEIQKLIRQGYHTLDEIKRVSRAGMGPCQGKTCGPIIQREIARIAKIPIDKQKPPKVRPPMKGIKLGVLAGGDQHEE